MVTSNYNGRQDGLQLSTCRKVQLTPDAEYYTCAEEVHANGKASERSHFDHALHHVEPSVDERDA